MTTRKLRVLVLMHPDLIPPDNFDALSEDRVAEIKTEIDVCWALNELGHHVLKLGIEDDLTPLRRAILDWQPHIAFNLLAEFQNDSALGHGVINYLELMGVPYTGCNPRGLLVARDKALTKQILAYHEIRTPAFEVYPKGRKLRTPRELEYPVIVKSASEEASLGLSQSSVVNNDQKFLERVAFMHDSVGSDAIVEEFIEGREITQSVMGAERLTTFPVWELDISGLPDTSHGIATFKVKWDLDYQKRHNVRLKRASGLSEHLEAHIKVLSKRIYRALKLSGYARMDFRLTPEQKLYFLEANPNPDIAADDDFAESAAAMGLEYPALIQKILNQGLRDGVSFRQAS